MKSFFLQLFL
jgi:hypothetical protein